MARNRHRQQPDTAASIAALAARVHPEPPPAAPRLLDTCRHCGIRGECDPATRMWIVGIDSNEIAFGVCPDCQPFGTDHRALSAHAVAVVLGVNESEEAVHGITVESFASKASIGQHTGPNKTPWAHLGREQLAGQVRRNRDRIAALTSTTPCPYCGVTRTPVGTRWVQPGGRNAVVMCGGCAHMFSDADGGFWPAGQWRSIAAGNLVGVTGRMFRLGEEVGLLYWSESGRTDPNTKAWGHVDRVAMYRRALRLPPVSFGGHNGHQWRHMVEAVATADAERLSDADRATIVAEVEDAVKGDGTRKRLASRFDVSLDVIEYIAGPVVVEPPQRRTRQRSAV